MKLIKTTCEIRYEASKYLDAYRGIYQDIMKKEPDVKGWTLPGMRLDNKEKRTIVIVEPNRSVIDIEEPPNVGYCVDNTVQFFKSVYERIGIEDLRRLGLRSTWILEYPGSFEALLSLYKSKIFSNFPLLTESNDAGALVDYTQGEKKKAITIGPMAIEQLKSLYLFFEPKSIKSPFLYIDIDVGDTSKQKFSLQYLPDFVASSIKEGQEVVEKTIAHFGVS